MNKSTKIQLDRVKEHLSELEIEYEKSLRSKEVSDKALVITHEIFEKLSNILDQIAFKIWKHAISSDLSSEEQEKVGKRIYFPAQLQDQDFENKMIEWKAKDVKSLHPEVYTFLRNLQPFISEHNLWIKTLKELSNKKHIGLVAQKKQEITNVTYSNAFGTVMFNAESVKFGEGASILGAPVDPVTQRIIPTAGVNEKIEKWVSFKLEGYDLDALSFCKQTTDKVEKIVIEAYRLFGLT